uniref:Uncharacterized protein n=1 Tax=viral metagenome TaxID=1070528 RepID=A0A6C0ED05_9ZZZZ
MAAKYSYKTISMKCYHYKFFDNKVDDAEEFDEAVISCCKHDGWKEALEKISKEDDELYIVGPSYYKKK